MSIFGRILSDDVVEDAVKDTLKKWINTYLSEVERQRGLDEGYFPRPRTWAVHNAFEGWPSDSLPAVIIVSTGLDDSPTKSGGGKYRAKYAIGVAVVVSAKDQESTRRMAYRYAAALRTILVHRQSLNGELDGLIGTTWLDGRNNELPAEDDRSLWATRQLFSIEVDDVVTQGAGPTSPDPDPDDPQAPYPDWPTVPDRDHVQITTTKEAT